MKEYLAELEVKVKVVIVFPTTQTDSALNWVPFLKRLRDTYQALQLYMIPICASYAERENELRGRGKFTSETLLDLEVRKGVFPIFVEPNDIAGFLLGINPEEITLLLISGEGKVLNHLSGCFNLDKGVSLTHTVRSVCQIQ
jgi:hypothetical protein